MAEGHREQAGEPVLTTTTDKTFSSFLYEVKGNIVKLVIQGVEYEYEMANENMASKAEWIFRSHTFFQALNWLKSYRVNEKRLP